MLKKLFFIFMVCFSSLAISQHADYEVIDLAEIDLSGLPGYELYDWEQVGEKYSPFNRAIEFGPFFNYLKTVYQIDVVLETGTWKGATTQFLGFLFDEVHGIELKEQFYNTTAKNTAKYPNVFLHLGSSPKVLSSLLPKLCDKRPLFYLDAHWFAHWPLLNELEVISKTHRDNCIIVIDDFKVPERPDIPYDEYKDNDCSYPYIKDKLSKVFSSYVYYYVLPKSPASRAKFVGIPEKWIDK